MTCGALNPMPEAAPYRRSPDTVMPPLFSAPDVAQSAKRELAI